MKVIVFRHCLKRGFYAFSLTLVSFVLLLRYPLAPVGLHHGVSLEAEDDRLRDGAERRQGPGHPQQQPRAVRGHAVGDREHRGAEPGHVTRGDTQVRGVQRATCPWI